MLDVVAEDVDVDEIVADAVKLEVALAVIDAVPDFVDDSVAVALDEAV